MKWSTEQVVMVLSLRIAQAAAAGKPSPVAMRVLKRMENAK